MFHSAEQRGLYPLAHPALDNFDSILLFESNSIYIYRLHCKQIMVELKGQSIQITNQSIMWQQCIVLYCAHAQIKKLENVPASKIIQLLPPAQRIKFETPLYRSEAKSTWPALLPGWVKFHPNLRTGFGAHSRRT